MRLLETIPGRVRKGEAKTDAGPASRPSPPAAAATGTLHQQVTSAARNGPGKSPVETPVPLNQGAMQADPEHWRREGKDACGPSAVTVTMHGACVPPQKAVIPIKSYTASPLKPPRTQPNPAKPDRGAQPTLNSPLFSRFPVTQSGPRRHAQGSSFGGPASP